MLLNNLPLYDTVPIDKFDKHMTSMFRECSCKQESCTLKYAIKGCNLIEIGQSVNAVHIHL